MRSRGASFAPASTTPVRQPTAPARLAAEVLGGVHRADDDEARTPTVDVAEHGSSVERHEPAASAADELFGIDREAVRHVAQPLAVLEDEGLRALRVAGDVDE